MLQKPPVVAVIVPTILPTHREPWQTAGPDDVIECVQSILNNLYAPLQVFVVDQSPDDRTASALRPLVAHDARLRYLRAASPGKSRALNLAIRQSDAGIFLTIDDDCHAPPDWVASAVAAFQRHPDAGVIFGDVTPPPAHDWTVSYVPALSFETEHRLPAAFLVRAHNLMGANMAIRRSTFEQIGLFDEVLGPGSPFGAYNEEVDFHLRALRAKPSIGVYVTPAFSVEHTHGARPLGKPARDLLRTYESGKSAFLTKHARHGDFGALCTLALLAFAPIYGACTNLLRSGRPRGLGMEVPYFRGIRRGLRVARATQVTPLAASSEDPPGG